MTDKAVNIKIGDWCVDCCCADAWQIKTEEDLEDANWRVADEDINARICSSEAQICLGGLKCKCKFNQNK